VAQEYRLADMGWVAAHVQRAKVRSRDTPRSGDLLGEPLLVVRWVSDLRVSLGAHVAHVYDREGWPLATVARHTEPGEFDGLLSARHLDVLSPSGELLFRISTERVADDPRPFRAIALDLDGSEIGRVHRSRLHTRWPLRVEGELLGTVAPWWTRSMKHWYDHGLRFEISDALGDEVAGIHVQPFGWHVVDIEADADITLRCLAIAVDALARGA
jgi:hypothetical protein